VENARGTIIRLTKLTETSLIVHWMTAEAGLMKTVAKGARRPKSTFSGKLDLFIDADLEWVPSRKSELHTLREVSVHAYRTELRKQYVKMVLGSYFGQLLEHVVEREHAEPEVYALLHRGLDYLCEGEATRAVLVHFERELAKFLGVGQDGKNAAAALEQAFGRVPRERQTCLAVLKEAE
jgi:DNA repair protein RecO (recombination protein O)